MNKSELTFVVLAAAWAGLILGVSFIATPAKFLAPSIALPVALDVGRATFRISLLVEFVFGLGLAAAAVSAFGWSGRTLIALALLLAVAAQRFVLFPILDTRTGLVMAGTPLPPSWHHLAWIAADAMRFLFLLGLSITALREGTA